MFPFARFNVQISNETMENHKLKICASKNGPWHHTLLTAHLRDTSVMWSQAAPTGLGNGEQSWFRRLFRMRKLLRHALQRNDANFNLTNRRHSWAAFETNYSRDHIEATSLCSGHNNVPQSKIKRKSVFSYWSATLTSFQIRGGETGEGLKQRVPDMHNPDISRLIRLNPGSLLAALLVRAKK